MYQCTITIISSCTLGAVQYSVNIIMLLALKFFNNQMLTRNYNEETKTGMSNIDYSNSINRLRCINGRKMYYKQRSIRAIYTNEKMSWFTLIYLNVYFVMRLCTGGILTIIYQLLDSIQILYVHRKCIYNLIN